LTLLSYHANLGFTFVLLFYCNTCDIEVARKKELDPSAKKEREERLQNVKSALTLYTNHISSSNNRCVWGRWGPKGTSQSTVDSHVEMLTQKKRLFRKMHPVRK